MELAVPLLIACVGVALIVFRERIAEANAARWGSRFARIGLGHDRTHKAGMTSQLLVGGIFVLVGLYGTVTFFLP